MSQIKTFINFLESITTEENAHLLEGVKAEAKKIRKKEKKAEKKAELKKMFEAWESATPEQKKMMKEKLEIEGNSESKKLAKDAVGMMGKGSKDNLEHPAESGIKD